MGIRLAAAVVAHVDVQDAVALGGLDFGARGHGFYLYPPVAAPSPA